MNEGSKRIIPLKRARQEIVQQHREEQYARQRVDADPLAELALLHDALAGFSKAYETGPAAQRQAICDSIIAVAAFLRSQGYSDRTLMPINRVVGAIAEICNQNRPDPLFCEKKARTKPKRSMQNAILLGHLAAFADAWLRADLKGSDPESVKLKRASKRLSGNYFGQLEVKKLKSAMSYQRQPGHQALLYDAYRQMQGVLEVEASHVGGDEAGLMMAIEVQIDSLNEQADSR